ncbi:HlyD family secretion protein [Eilatimonas milleporae]|uniref:HlyD family secretion protein n=1 Tax=Eilatimonas milleporae TaxID=911205 RepID=UPI000EF9E782|nr:HlyD family efflux transporter periplasmic adaptor subunit [Eilatimonas milleporae]
MEIAHTSAKAEAVGYRFELESIEGEFRALKARIDLQSSLVASAQRRHTDGVTLNKKGVLTAIELERREQDWLSAQSQLEALQAQASGLDNRKAQAQLNLEAIEPSLQNAMAEFDTRLSNLAQERINIQGQDSYALVTSTSGRLTSLSITGGSQVTAGKAVATVLPQGGVLEAHLLVPSRAAGFVEKGQDVRLLYAAFPYQRFGSFDGVISNISTSIIAPQDANVPVSVQEPFYQVKVALSDRRITAFGKTYDLQPGMLLDANIILERQSFLSWLLEPLRAVRERT